MRLFILWLYFIASVANIYPVQHENKYYDDFTKYMLYYEIADVTKDLYVSYDE